MKPIQPSIGDMNDRIDVYEITQGARNSSGGTSQTEALRFSLWANVNMRSSLSKSSFNKTGREEIITHYDIITRKGSIRKDNQVEYLGQRLEVKEVINSNKSFDKVICIASNS